MLEQEVASIIKFVLDSAGNPAPFYNEIKENFVVPSCYFPAPEIDTDGETFSAYRLRYNWFIKFFHKTTEEAYAIARNALIALKGARNSVPIIDTDGKPTGEILRLLDPSIKKLDSGVYQLSLAWDSRRPYNDPEYPLSADFSFIKDVYSEKELTDEMIEQVRDVETYTTEY